MDLGMPCLRLTCLVAVFLPMTACVTLIEDLSVGPVAVRTAPAVGQLPERQVISISLRTRTDLSRVPKDDLIHFKTYFCDSPKDFVLLGGAVAPLWNTVAKPDSSGIYTYVFLLEVRRRGSPNSRPPEVGFDFSTAPRTVCIKLQGGYIGMYASSNTVQVRAESIREALARPDGKPGG